MHPLCLGHDDNEQWQKIKCCIRQLQNGLPAKPALPDKSFVDEMITVPAHFCLLPAKIMTRFCYPSFCSQNKCFLSTSVHQLIRTETV